MCVCVCDENRFCFGIVCVCVCVWNENRVKIFKTMESRKWGGHTRGLLTSALLSSALLPCLGTVPGPSPPPSPLPGSPAHLSAPPFPHPYSALSYFELLVLGIICKPENNNSSSSSQDLCVPCPFDLGIWGEGGSGES